MLVFSLRALALKLASYATEQRVFIMKTSFCACACVFVRACVRAHAVVQLQRNNLGAFFKGTLLHNGFGT